MDTKSVIFICFALVNNSFSMNKSSVGENFPVQAAAILCSEESNRNLYSGIIDAFLKAHENCKAEKELLKKDSIKFVQQIRSHLFVILADAFISMDSAQKRICRDVIANLYSLATDAKSMLELMQKSGRSAHENAVLVENFKKDSIPTILALAMYLGPLEKVVSEHGGLNKKFAENADKIKVVENQIMAYVIEVLKQAHELAGKDLQN